MTDKLWSCHGGTVSTSTILAVAVIALSLTVLFESANGARYLWENLWHGPDSQGAAVAGVKISIVNEGYRAYKVDDDRCQTGTISQRSACRPLQRKLRSQAGFKSVKSTENDCCRRSSDSSVNSARREVFQKVEVVAAGESVIPPPANLARTIDSNQSRMLP